MPRPSAARKRALEAVGDTYPWESEAVAAKLQGVLNAMEIPLIDAGARKTLKEMLYRRDKYNGGTGAEHVTLLITRFLNPKAMKTRW